MARGGGKRSFHGGGGAGGSGGEANKRAKYLPKGSGNSIPLGSRGFLVSCVSGKEAEAGREIVDALEEEYERMAKEESKKSLKTSSAAAAAASDKEGEKEEQEAPAAAAAAEEGDEEEEDANNGADLASALAAEISDLKGKDAPSSAAANANAGVQKKKKRGLRFHALGLPGLVFVSGAGSAAIAAAAAATETTAGGEKAETDAGTSTSPPPPPPPSFNPPPSEVARSLCARVRGESAGTTRFCLRLLPADDVVFVGGVGGGGVTGKTDTEEAAAASKAAVEAAARAITVGLRPLLAPHFRRSSPSLPRARTFAVAYEKRASSAALERRVVIDAAMAALPAKEGEGEGEGETEEIKVDLDAPDVTALIQVVKGAATLGVVRDYRGLLKLNLRELAAPGSTAAADNARKRMNGGGGGGGLAGKTEEEKKEEEEEEKKEEKAE